MQTRAEALSEGVPVPICRHHDGVGTHTGTWTIHHMHVHILTKVFSSTVLPMIAWVHRTESEVLVQQPTASQPSVVSSYGSRPAQNGGFDQSVSSDRLH